MLYEIALGIDHTWDNGHVLGRLVRLERGGLVLTARVGELEADRADIRLIKRRQHHLHRHVVDMRPFPVAPADMEPYAVAGNAF